MQKQNSKGAGIDFIAFANEYIAKLENNGQRGYAESVKAAVRNLTDYFGRSSVSIKEINIENVSGFISYMQKPRTVQRVDRFGNVSEVEKRGVKPQTLKDYLGDIKTIFNAACEKYNGEDQELAIITHNPFTSKKLRITVNREPQKRTLSTEDIAKILNTEEVPGKRMQLARDVLAMSFYLVAMNTADLFDDDAKLIEDRLEYRRMKTRTRRGDEAIMSIRIEPEALPLMRKYRDPERKRLSRLHLIQMRAAYEAGFKKCAETLGILKPYLNLNQAYKLYGRGTVDRWANEKLITIIKDGTGTSKCRIKRDEIELVASLSNRSSWYEHYE